MRRLNIVEILLHKKVFTDWPSNNLSAICLIWNSGWWLQNEKWEVECVKDKYGTNPPSWTDVCLCIVVFSLADTFNVGT